MKKAHISPAIKELIESISHLNIFPDFTIEAKKVRGLYCIHVKKYPIDLGDYIDELSENGSIAEKDLGNIPTNIYTMIDKLHNFGILHGDLHAKNIVIDPDTEEVRIIDFEEKYFLYINDSKIKPDYEHFCRFWGTETPLQTLDDLKNYERNMWKIGYLDGEY